MSNIRIADYQLIDLSHAIDENTPSWDGNCGFHRKIVHDYHEGARVYEYRFLGGTGTHMDAPSHFFPNGVHIDQIPLQNLIASLCVVDLMEEVTPQSQVGLKEIENYEKHYGPIPSDSIVIAHTGWWRNWESPDRYRNLNAKEEIEVPTIAPEVGQYLFDCDVLGIGIDTLSPDPYGSEYPIHNLFLKAGKYLIENLTNLDQVPKKGAYLLLLPLKIRGGTESPVRAVALIP